MKNKTNIFPAQIVSEITKRILLALDILRGTLMPQEYVSFSLLLLTLYKEKIDFKDVVKINKGNDKIPAESFSTPDITSQFEEGLFNKIRKGTAPLSVIIDNFHPIFISLDNIVWQKLFFLFSEIDRKVLEDNFAEIFDGVLYELMKSQKRHKDEYILPRELSHFVANVVDCKPGEKVYNPYAGLASFGVFINPEANYLGQEINRTTWTLGALRLIAHGRKGETEFLNGNSIENWNPKNKLYDIIIANPPFGLRKDWGAEDRPFFDIESDLIYSAVHSINQTGKAVIIVPTKVLYSRANNSIRQLIVNEDLAEKVILLPSGLLSNTNISSAVLILNKQKSMKGKVLFINGGSFINARHESQKELLYNDLLAFCKNDSETDEKKWVNICDIKNNDLSLLPTSYLLDALNLPTEHSMEELGNLITPVQRVPFEENIKARFVRIRDLSDNPIEFVRDYKTVEEVEIPRHASVLPNETLLVAMRWNTLKPTFFSGSEETVYFSFSDILAAKINVEKVDPEYLVNELYADYVKQQIEYIRSGQFIPGVSRAELLKIKIQVPSPEEQKDIVILKKRAIIKEEEYRLQQLKKNLLSDTAEEEALLRHKIRGKVSNLESSFEKFLRIFSEKIALSDETVYQLQANGVKRTLGEYLKIIGRDIKSISEQVNIAGHEIDFLKVEFSRINSIEFIQAYCLEIQDRTGLCFKLALRIFDEELFKDGTIKICINGNDNLLREAFDNLIENAQIHAFKNTFSIKNEIYVSVFLDFDAMNLHVNFTNNGIPVPQGFSFTSAIKQPGMAEKQKNDGVGLWFINQVMKKHGGKFSFTDETGLEGLEDDSVSTFELIFPFEIERSDESDVV